VISPPNSATQSVPRSKAHTRRGRVTLIPREAVLAAPKIISERLPCVCSAAVSRLESRLYELTSLAVNLISGPAKAWETGHFCLDVSANSRKAFASIFGTSASASSSMVVIFGPAPR